MTPKQHAEVLMIKAIALPLIRFNHWVFNPQKHEDHEAALNHYVKQYHLSISDEHHIKNIWHGETIPCGLRREDIRLLLNLSHPMLADEPESTYEEICIDFYWIIRCQITRQENFQDTMPYVEHIIVANHEPMVHAGGDSTLP